MIDIHIDCLAHDLWVLSALKDGEDFELGCATAETSKQAITLAKQYKKRNNRRQGLHNRRRK